MNKSFKFHLKLFAQTFQISAFTFGGGFVIISLMKKQLVEKLGWLDEKEMLDFTALAQSSPGAVAVNASLLVGYRLAGITGAATALLGTILPPLLIITGISYAYDAFQSNIYIQNSLKGMQAAVAAVIADVVINLGGKIVKEKSVLNILVMIASFVCVAFLKVNIILVILVCGIIGLISTLIKGKKGGEK
ncbi:MAG TPA: chromate transporter [Candidatus Avimonas sp.]|jgi:chromate transporter|nr:chromate transporter [Clostridiales bacterium]HOB36335.1 chromate transporter [Candidatus Avimonas sp.]HQA15826.1 chromate transporter [Candidatus Avimonas sp.]HQD37788.1 chromate transporter [Candidatus Avimonas sp.]